MRPDYLIKDGRKTTCTIRHRTLDDVQLAMRTAMQRTEDGTRCSSVNGDYSFCATKDMPEYIDMLENGWSHGVEGVEGLDGLATDRAESIAFTRNVGGAFPIVPAHLAGVPDAMLSPTIQPVDSVRGLTLVIDSCFNAGVSPETVLTYARTVMRMVAWLAAEQIEVAVYMVVPIMLGQSRNKRVMYVTPIREAGQVFQPERVASILHPSWLRRAWFSLLEYDYYDRDVSDAVCCKGGYGTVTHANADELRKAIPEAYSVILLPKIGYSDPEAAIREAVNLKLQRGEF